MTLKTVETELKKLNPKRFNLIREFYFKVADSLPQLAEELEFADLDIGEGDPDMEAGPLLDQHLIICEMMEAFKRIELGKYV